MPSIQIVSTPPGFAPANIRELWVGILIPLVSPEEAEKAERQMDPSSESVGGYIVRGADAVRVLEEAGRHEAAAFWASPAPPAYLRFKRDVCEVRS